MPSHLIIRKNGQIFINAAGRDSHEIVRRRAARIALRENESVNYQVINRNEYIPMNVSVAEIIMTPRAWIEEMRDCFSDPLSHKEVKELQKRGDYIFIKMELEKERVLLHQKCLKVDKEINRVVRMISA